MYVEGEKTEQVYFVHWNRQYRDIVVDIYPRYGLTPKEMVQRAIKDWEADIRDAKRQRGPAFDEYWCVFDVDQHPKLRDALTLAAENGIRVALSNPCFELWFLIHFQDQTAYIDRHAAQRGAYEHMGCRKNCMTQSELEKLDEHYGTAAERARKLDAWHSGNGSKPASNPSTNVWELNETIRLAETITSAGVPLNRPVES
ncbi:RloB family protein [Mycobacterium kansasii]